MRKFKGLERYHETQKTKKVNTRATLRELKMWKKSTVHAM